MKNSSEERTHSFKLLLELSEVLALAHAEVVVRVISLVDGVGRRGRADGQHRRCTLRPLTPSDLLDCGHRNIRVYISTADRRRPESTN